MQRRVQQPARVRHHISTSLGIDRRIWSGPRLWPQRQRPAEISKSKNRKVCCHNKWGGSRLATVHFLKVLYVFLYPPALPKVPEAQFNVRRTYYLSSLAFKRVTRGSAITNTFPLPPVTPGAWRCNRAPGANQKVGILSCHSGGPMFESHPGLDKQLCFSSQYLGSIS